MTVSSSPILVERLAEEMAERWRAGEQSRVEDYLARYPALADDPEAALELLAEEIGLRDEGGQGPDADELASRFPHWRRQVLALLECHRALSIRLGRPRFPAAGESLGDFRLLAELGRGGHGRVFLASAAVARRPSRRPQAGAAGRAASTCRWRAFSTRTSSRCYSVHDFPEPRPARPVSCPTSAGPRWPTLLDAPAATSRPAAGPAATCCGPCNSSRRGTRWPCPCAARPAGSWRGPPTRSGLLGRRLPGRRPALRPRARPAPPGPEAVQRAARRRRPADAPRLPPRPRARWRPGPACRAAWAARGATCRPSSEAALAATVGRAGRCPRRWTAGPTSSRSGVLLYEALGGRRAGPGDVAGRRCCRRNPQVTPGLADLLARCLAAEADGPLRHGRRPGRRPAPPPGRPAAARRGEPQPGGALVQVAPPPAVHPAADRPAAGGDDYRGPDRGANRAARHGPPNRR